jgi:hypothetical protein
MCVCPLGHEIINHRWQSNQTRRGHVDHSPLPQSYFTLWLYFVFFSFILFSFFLPFFLPFHYSTIPPSSSIKYPSITIGIYSNTRPFAQRCKLQPVLFFTLSSLFLSIMLRRLIITLSFLPYSHPLRPRSNNILLPLLSSD